MESGVQEGSEKKNSRLFNYLAFLMAFFLPLLIKLSNFFLIFFFIYSVYHIFKEKRHLKKSSLLLTYTTLSIFIMYAVSLFFSDNFFSTFNVLGRNISFVLCPLLLFFQSRKNILGIRMWLMKGLVLGAVCSIIILLVNNCYNYFLTRPIMVFDIEIFSYYYTYYSFTDLFQLHPTYLGTYVMFSIMVVLNNTLKFKPVLKLSVLLLLSTGVLFINSRIIFFIYGITLVVYLVNTLRLLNKNINLRSLVFTGGSIIVMIIFVYVLIEKTLVFSRLNKELSWELTEQVGTTFNNKTRGDSRIARWKVALKVIEEKPLLGHGIDMEKDVLVEGYTKFGLENSAALRYDAHNSYLSIAIEYGLFGLILYVFFLLSNIYISLRSKDVLYFGFFLMIAIVGLFENYMMLNAGITFVAMFGSVLFFSNIHEN